MKTPLLVLLIVCLIAFCILCAGCGNEFISASSDAGISTTSGLVSIVQLSSVMGTNGTTVEVTFVTFLQEGTSSTIGFCGDEASRFPMNQMLQTPFVPVES